MPYFKLNPDIYHQDALLPFIDLNRDIKPLRKSKLGVLSSLQGGMDKAVPIFAMLFMFGILGYALIAGIMGMI